MAFNKGQETFQRKIKAGKKLNLVPIFHFAKLPY